MFYTIAALLDGAIADHIHHLWDTLSTETTLVLKLPERRPHLSFIQGEFADTGQLFTTLHHIADEVRPFFVNLTGLAMFTGENPVIYMNVVKAPPLNHLQRTLYERLGPLIADLSPHYDPNLYAPHLTIGWVDDPSGTPQAFERLGTQSFTTEFLIDNLTLLSPDEGPTRLDFADA